MRNSIFTHSAKVLIAAAILILAIGCSSESPLAPNSSSTQRGLGSPLSSVEFGSRVATTDPATRTLTFTTRPEVVIAAVDAEIVFKDGGSETPITFEDIAPGDSIEVRGDPQGNGTILADRIRIRPDESGSNEVELYGRVESIDPIARTMTLVGNSTLINVMANAEIEHHDEHITITLSFISPGDSVEIRGAAQLDGSLLADRVRLRSEDDSGDDDYDLEFNGHILSIDYAAETFTVESRTETVTVNANTAIYGDADHGPRFSPSPGGHHSSDDYLRISFDQLREGDYVEVKANIVDPSALLAVKIELEDDDNFDIEFKATLASVDMESRTVTFQENSTVGTVMNGALLAGLNNEPLTLEDFSVGQLVEVRGFEDQSTGEFLIDRMHKEDSL